MLRIRTPSLGGLGGTSATALGVTATATASVPTVGAATAASTAAGVTSTATASAIVGAGTASVDVAGVTSTATATSTVGAATADSEAAGVTVSATASASTVGAATAASTAAGVTATATASATAGAPAADSEASGVTATATASSIVGIAYGATADATASGVTATLSASAVVGTATASISVPGVIATADAIAIALGASGTYGTGAGGRPRFAIQPQRPTRHRRYLERTTPTVEEEPATDPWLRSGLRGNTILTPPRRSGNTDTDVGQVMDWLTDFHGTFAVEENIIGTVSALVIFARDVTTRLEAAEAKLTAIGELTAMEGPVSGTYDGQQLADAYDKINEIISSASSAEG